MTSFRTSAETRFYHLRTVISVPRRILYVNEDYELPSGGVRAIYRHVELLRSAGIEAFVVHQRSGFRLTWFESNAPVLYLDQLSDINSDDCVVIPETFDERQFSALNGARLFLNLQNHYYLFRGLGDRRFEERKIEAVLCGSEEILKFCTTMALADRLQIIPYGLSPSQDLAKADPPIITVMPRKRPKDYAFIRACFHQMFPKHNQVKWTVLETANEREAAASLARSSVLLSLAKSEGFGLPALEAMAAKCLVVGFHGGGGREYATTKNGYWSEDWDLVSCARNLGNALDALTEGNANLMIHNGLITAQRYTVERQRKALLEFWNAV